MSKGDGVPQGQIDRVNALIRHENLDPSAAVGKVVKENLGGIDGAALMRAWLERGSGSKR